MTNDEYLYTETTNCQGPFESPPINSISDNI